MRQVAGVRVVVLWCLQLTGCVVVSLHPVYEPDGRVFDEALVGNWSEQEGGATLRIERGEWDAYRVEFRDGTQSARLTAQLTTIGSARIADLTPERGQDFGPLLLPAHGVVRVTLAEDALTIAALDYDWFERAIKTHTLGRLGAVLDDRQNVILTAPTTALRGWLSSRLKAPAVFAEPMTFRRVTAAGPG
jgi:hypothetical protein